jgi:peptide/nickel transport system ATP-binding protein
MSLTGDAVLAIDDLTITDATGKSVLHKVSCRLGPGRRLGVVGESGAGKTTLALAALGVVRPGLRLASGTVELGGRNVFALPERARRSLRRHTTGWLGQDPAATLTPTMSVRRQITELLDAPSAARIADRLRAVSLPADQDFLSRLPHELSGGQQRRVALARALAGRPALLVLDEPTAGLDPVTGQTVIAEVERLQRVLGFALLVISHDLALIERTCDEVIVLRDGRVAEPEPPPVASSAPALTSPGGVLLRVDELHAGFGSADVLAGVSFDVRAGESVALVGGSGSGKSTLARAIAGLHPPRTGGLEYESETLPARARQRGARQRAGIQLVPQDPYGALHPRRSVQASVARPLRLLYGNSRAVAFAAAGRLLRRVGLDADLAHRRPDQLSGGQRQRVVLARALAARPRLLICDEITSALDTSTAHAILTLLEELRSEHGLAVLFISHDLTVVRQTASRLLVLADGTIAESGPIMEVLRNPRHRYTIDLVAAASRPPGVGAKRSGQTRHGVDEGDRAEQQQDGPGAAERYDQSAGENRAQR